MARDFVQRIPDAGLAASESTLVAVAYAETSVFIVFWCYDRNPELVDRQLVRRDRHSQADAIQITIDGYHDHITGYGFNVNASGVQRDWRIFDDTHYDNSWDGVWKSAVKIQPWGWSAEVEIPYRLLRFPNQPEQVWGINFARKINRRNEV